MATWRQIEAESPDFASRVRRCFDSGTNKTIATIRRDGSPRISGIELEFQDGRITLGMMGGSHKRLDVHRDPRVAIHSPTIEPPQGQPSEWQGDAKLSGTLVEFDAADGAPQPGGGKFELDIREAVLTYVDETNTLLVIESWHEGRGWQRRKRT